MQRTTEIAELRVYPFEAGCKAGEWSGVYKGRLAPLPKTRFSFTALRATLTERVFKQALAAVIESVQRQGGLSTFGEPVLSRQGSVDKRDRGRPGLSTTQYAELAVRYAELEEERQGRQSSTRRQLAKEFNIPETTVGKRLQRARSMGYLQQAKQGQRGGEATEPAYRVLERMKTREVNHG